MTKLDEPFKLQVVQQYLNGTLGYKALGKSLGLSYKAGGAEHVAQG